MFGHYVICKTEQLFLLRFVRWIFRQGRDLNKLIFLEYLAAEKYLVHQFLSMKY